MNATPCSPTASTVLAPVDRLVHSNEDRKAEVKVVSTAFYAVLSNRQAYVSTPITSGLRLYETARRHGMTPAAVLASRDLMVNEVIRPNVEAATAIARQIVDVLALTVISPAIFEAKDRRWGQDEYMQMWLNVINRQVTRIVLPDGWEYSNGACEEVMEAILMSAGYRVRTNIDVVRPDGTPITLEEVAERMLEAFAVIAEMGGEPRVLAESLHKLRYIQQEGRIALPATIWGRGSEMMRGNRHLLSEIDPMFLHVGSDDALWTARLAQPETMHLLRSREPLPPDVGMCSMTTDEPTAQTPGLVH